MRPVPNVSTPLALKLNKAASAPLLLKVMVCVAGTSESVASMSIIVAVEFSGKLSEAVAALALLVITGAVLSPVPVNVMS